MYNKELTRYNNLYANLISSHYLNSDMINEIVSSYPESETIKDIHAQLNEFQKLQNNFQDHFKKTVDTIEADIKPSSKLNQRGVTDLILEAQKATPFFNVIEKKVTEIQNQLKENDSLKLVKDSV